MTIYPKTTDHGALTETEYETGRIDLWDPQHSRLAGWTQRMPGAPVGYAWTAIWRDPATNAMRSADDATAEQAAAALRRALKIGA